MPVLGLKKVRHGEVFERLSFNKPLLKTQKVRYGPVLGPTRSPMNIREKLEIRSAVFEKRNCRRKKELIVRSGTRATLPR